MDSYEYGELLKELEIKRQNIEKIMQPSQLQSRIEEIESLEASLKENPELEMEILEVGDGLAISKIKEKVEI